MTDSPLATTRKPPRRTHTEKHSTAGDAVRDVIIGMSDGLTVPLALAAGISGAIASSHIVVTAGIAELAAGGISMGLGGIWLLVPMPNIMPASNGGSIKKPKRYLTKSAVRSSRSSPITALPASRCTNSSTR